MTEQQYKDAIALYHPAGGNKVGKIYDVRDITYSDKFLTYSTWNFIDNFAGGGIKSYTTEIENPFSSQRIIKLVGDNSPGGGQSNIMYSVGHRISILAKAGAGGQYLYLRGTINSGNRHVYDLVNGIVTYDETGSGQITDEGNGWFRCSFQDTHTGGEGRLEFAIVTTPEGVDGTGLASRTNEGKVIYVTGLNFDNSKELHPYSRTPKLDLTVTGGGGTRINKQGVLEEVAGHQPKIDYSTGKPAFLIEPQRTNFILHSQDFTQSQWTKQAGTVVSPNVAEAPDGTLTASKVTGGGLGIYQNVIGITGLNVKSIWLKSVDGNPITVQLKDSNNTKTTLNCNVTGTWERFSLEENQDTNITPGLWVSGINSVGVLMWGAQIEAPVMTSYISTTATAVTRTEPLFKLPLVLTDFDITMHVKFNQIVNNGSLLDGGARFYMQSQATIRYNNGSNITYAAFPPLNVGTEYELRMVKQDGVLTTYLDGVQQYQYTGVTGTLNQPNISGAGNQFNPIIPMYIYSIKFN